MPLGVEANKICLDTQFRERIDVGPLVVQSQLKGRHFSNVSVINNDNEKTVKVILTWFQGNLTGSPMHRSLKPKEFYNFRKVPICMVNVVWHFQP